jgi:hypothetical protein
VSQSQSGGWVYLTVNLEAGCVSESVGRLDVSQRQCGGCMSQIQSGGLMCLSQSGGFVCVSESVWRVGVSHSQSGGWMCLSVIWMLP